MRAQIRQFPKEGQGYSGEKKLGNQRPVSYTHLPDDSRPQIPGNSGTGNLEDGSTDTPTEIPQTGEGVAVYPILLLILSAGGLVLALRLKKRVH